jgi:hypothetical protein
MAWTLRNVRYWPKADIASRPSNVAIGGKADITRIGERGPNHKATLIDRVAA